MKISFVLVLLGVIFLAGCETMQAVSEGEVAGKPRKSNYTYTLPDRYDAELK